MGVWYAEKVVDGSVPSCRYERLAAERFLRMLRESREPTCEWRFSIRHVVDACDFIEKLPHVKAFSGRIKLEPVQCWWLAAIFGFRDRRTGRRWTRQATLLIPRKNAKSTLSAGIALFCATCENEPGPEILISAGSVDQANKVYTPIRKMIDAEPELRAQFKVTDTRDAITLHAVGAEIRTVATVAKNADGFNPHVVVAEELHAQKQEVVSVLSTAQGSRLQPLFLSIGTAGRQSFGPAYDDMRQCIAVLEGTMKSDRLFCAIYMIEEKDAGKNFDMRVIEKVNPLFGVSLNSDSLEKEIRDAGKSESDLNEYKRTRLNVWTRAAGNLIAVDGWRKCADGRLNLDIFRGFPMFVGLDLASRSDLVAAQFLIEIDNCLHAVGKYWIGRNVPRMQDDRFADAFAGWADDGWLTFTDAHDGTFVDFGAVLADTLEMVEGHRVVGFGLDDYQANHMASQIEGQGHAVYIVKKNARALTPATDDLLARVGNPDLLQHDGNPVTEWCAGNVVGFYDANSNVLPKKEKPNSRANIDGIDAFIIANAIRMDYNAGTLGQSEKDKERVNPYMGRGLAGATA